MILFACYVRWNSCEMKYSWKAHFSSYNCVGSKKVKVLRYFVIVYAYIKSNLSIQWEIRLS